MSDEQKTSDAIGELLSSMTDRIREENKTDPLYVELAGQRSLESRLRLACHEMSKVVLTLTDVLRDVDGVEITRERYALLQGLVAAKSNLEEHYRLNEGNAGCVDKAHREIARLLIEEWPPAPSPKITATEIPFEDQS